MATPQPLPELYSDLYKLIIPSAFESSLFSLKNWQSFRLVNRQWKEWSDDSFTFNLKPSRFFDFIDDLEAFEFLVTRKRRNSICYIIDSLFDKSFNLSKEKIVEILMKTKESCSIQSKFDSYLMKTVRSGWHPMTGVLLRDPRIDPSSNNNSAIITASQYGTNGVVSTLLADKRVNPADCNNQAIRHACLMGWTKVVKTLLNDARVDPSDQNNECIRNATLNNHHKIVDLLLKDHRVDPTVNDNETVRKLTVPNFSCKTPCYLTALALMKDGRVDFSAGSNAALNNAIGSMHYQLMALLLSDPRVQALQKKLAEESALNVQSNEETDAHAKVREI